MLLALFINVRREISAAKRIEDFTLVTGAYAIILDKRVPDSWSLLMVALFDGICIYLKCKIVDVYILKDSRVCIKVPIEILASLDEITFGLEYSF